MNDLAPERIAKPKSDDMSMDEILASIRKIIASDDDKRHIKPTEDLYAYDNRHEKSDSQKNQQSLSPREQLLSLTKPDLYDTNIRNERHRVQTRFDKIDQINQSKPVYDSGKTDFKSKMTYQKLSMHENSAPVAEIDDDKLDHDEEILRALNEIRDTLSSTYSSGRDDLDQINAISNQDAQFEVEGNQRNPNNLNKDHTGKVVDATLRNNRDNILHDIDLKPAQFSGDAVPEFLKKFKKHQVSEREKNNSSVTSSSNVNYDFSTVPNFDETGEVITLTEKIMPTTKDKLKLHDLDEPKNTRVIPPKNDFSKLRQSTEEIMKRATEHNIVNNDDLSEEDSPMASVIMRTLRPMLQEWIDENMQSIAEQVLREEFRRGLK